MAKRYELTTTQWECIHSLLPGKVGDPGRSGVDNRVFVNGVLWVLRSGARWSDLCRNGMANTRPSTNGSPAGQKKGYGNGFSRC